MRLLKSVYKENPIDESVYSYWLGLQKNNQTVTQILYHEPCGEGDAHYVDVEFDDGNKMRIFRPDAIEFLVVN